MLVTLLGMDNTGRHLHELIADSSEDDMPELMDSSSDDSEDYSAELKLDPARIPLFKSMLSLHTITERMPEPHVLFRSHVDEAVVRLSQGMTSDGISPVELNVARFAVKREDVWPMDMPEARFKFIHAPLPCLACSSGFFHARCKVVAKPL